MEKPYCKRNEEKLFMESIFQKIRNIILINGSPTELNRDAYKHVYLLTKGAQSKTRIARLISDQKL